MFKLNKYGSSYSVLHNFSSADDRSPRAGLTQEGDGLFYGTTYQGGELALGTVFRLWPPETPDLIGVARVGNKAEISFSGVGGYQYQILRSSNLNNWSALATIIMPSTGIYTNVESNPAFPTAFYHVAWVP